MEDNVKGLKNTGNMCFLNVVIQALFNLVSVKEFFNIVRSHQHELNDEEVLKEIIEFHEEIEKDKLLVDEAKNLERIISLGLKNDNIKTKIKTSNILNEIEGVQVINTKNNGCMFCLLQNFFYNYVFSNVDSLSVQYIRGILITLNDDIQKFNEKGVRKLFNKMCCSAETLEEMLVYFHRSNIFPHYNLYRGKARVKLEAKLDKIRCKDKCLCHSLFTMKHKELIHCRECDTVSDLIPENSEIQTNIFYLYTSDLIEMESRRQSDDKTVTFSDLFKKQPFRNSGKLDILNCTSCNSNEHLEIMRMPTEASKVVVLNIIPTPGETSKIIEKVYTRIDSEIRISQMFELKNKFYNNDYTLRGLICFKGLHYIYIGYYISLHCWFMLNDENCTPYQSWKQLRSYLIKNGWFPVLIFYENNQYLSTNEFDIIEDPFKKEAPKNCLVF